jgi:hypothetical protein
VTVSGLEPNWIHPSPAEAFGAVITASERASVGDQAGSINAINNAAADSRWLAITGIRTLGSLMAGPDLSERFTTLRGEVIRLAAEADADPAVVALNGDVIDMAEAWLARDFDSLDTITRRTQFAPSDHAKVAAQICGQLVAAMAGDRSAEAFATLRRKHIEGGAP